MDLVLFFSSKFVLVQHIFEEVALDRSAWRLAINVLEPWPLCLVGFISILPQLAWDKRLCCCCCCASSPVQRLRTVLPSPVGVWVSVSLTLQIFFAHTKYHLESNTVITCRSPTRQKVHWFCSHHIRSNSFFLFLFSFFAETRLLRS